MGGARASVWVQFVEAISGGSHVVLHPVQEAVMCSSCCDHIGRGCGGHHHPAHLLPAAAMVTITVVLGAVLPPCCRLSRIAGQRGCKRE